MDLELSEDQFALRDGIRSLLEGRFDIDRVRRGFDRSVWDELAEAGVLSLATDGFLPADIVVVLEQLGIAAVPGPIIDAIVTRELVGDLGIVSVLERPFAGDVAMVEHADTLDTLIVLDGDGLWRVDPGALDLDAAQWPLDPLTPVSAITNLPHGEQIGDAGAAATCRRNGAVYTAAFLLGMAQRLTDLSVEYAKERIQFDRPIGSFQAVKHLLADMLVRTEVARAAVYAAGAHLGDPELEGLDRAASTAKVVAGEAAITNGKTATQVHGGMGFTWEVDVHLYLKRAWLLDTHFGSVETHSDLVAATL